MFGISMWELLIVGLILFIAVGPAKLPGLAKQLGKGIKDLRRGIDDIKGQVDKDDEFVKAVSEARQTVAEAKESFRSLIEDVVTPDDEEDDYERARDPNPRGVPQGRKMVRAAGDEETDEDVSALPPAEESAPEPVEAEDWRTLSAASSPEAEPDDAAAPSPERRVGRSPGDDAVPERPARRSSTGRRMIKPGRSRPHGSGGETE